MSIRQIRMLDGLVSTHCFRIVVVAPTKGIIRFFFHFAFFLFEIADREPFQPLPPRAPFYVWLNEARPLKPNLTSSHWIAWAESVTDELKQDTKNALICRQCFDFFWSSTPQPNKLECLYRGGHGTNLG